MESTFHATVYSVVDRLLERIATECMEDKPKLWAIWKEMFSFPQDPPMKEKKAKEVPKETKEVKEVKEVKEEKKPVKKQAKEEKKPVKETKPEPEKVVLEEKEAPKVVLEEEKEAPKEEKKVVLEEEKPKEAPKEEKKVVLEEEPAPKVVIEEEPAPKVVIEEEKEAPKAKPGTCPWVYTKGPRQGQVCGVGIYSKHPESGLCHSHYKK